MLNQKTWADDNVIYAAAKLYDLNIKIWQVNRNEPLTIGSSSTGRNVHIGYVSCVKDEEPSHYVSLRV